MSYDISDIRLVKNAIDVIKSHPLIYGGPEPRGKFLISQLAKSLIYDEYIPISIEKIDDWWNRIVPTPEYGEETFRAEVLLTALSKGLITCTSKGIDYIVRYEEINSKFESRLLQISKDENCGRVVALLA